MKATQAVIKQRVEKVFELRLNGAEFFDIRQYAAQPEEPDQPWGVSDRQLWRYIQAADKLFAKAIDVNAAGLLERHILQRRRLYAHAMDVGDYRTALAVLQDEAEMERLYPAKQLQHTGPKGLPIPVAAVELSDEQLAAIIAAGGG